ncbi:MAG: TIGR02147 family protein [Bacteriovoracia bacterium]
MNRPDIHQYNDPVAFLKDWLAFQRGAQPKFSQRALAKSAGLTPAHLPLVIKGARSLTQKALEKLIPLMDLSPAEANFFRSLRTITKSRDTKARREAFQTIQNFATYRRLNPKEFEVYRYLSRWFYVAIREMSGMSHFQLDPEWIQKRLVYPVPLIEIKKAVQFLVDHGYIEKTQPSSKLIECDAEVYRVAMAEYHKSMLDLVAESIQRVDREHRHILGFSIGMDQKTFHEVRTLIEETMAKIYDLTQKNPARDSVYYVTLAAIPMARESA